MYKFNYADQQIAKSLIHQFFYCAHRIILDTLHRDPGAYAEDDNSFLLCIYLRQRRNLLYWRLLCRVWVS